MSNKDKEVEEIVDNPIYASKWLRNVYSLDDYTNLLPHEVEELLQTFINTEVKQALTQAQQSAQREILDSDEKRQVIDFITDYSPQLTRGNLYTELNGADKMTMRDMKKNLMKIRTKLLSTLKDN